MRTKHARQVRRREVSSATPAAIGTVARAWKSGNSNGASKGAPKTGSFGWSRSTPSSWNTRAVQAVWVWRNACFSSNGASSVGAT